MIEENEFPGGTVSAEEVDIMTARYTSGKVKVNPETLRFVRLGKQIIQDFLDASGSDEMDLCLCGDSEDNPTILFRPVDNGQESHEGGLDHGNRCPPLCK